MYWQATQACQRLKVNGSPLDGGIGFCTSGCAGTALGAEIAADIPDVAPFVICDIHPALSLEANPSIPLTGQLSEVEALRVFDLRPALNTLLEAGYGQRRADQALTIADLCKTSPWTPRVAPYAAAPGQAFHQETALLAPEREAQAEMRKHQAETPLSDTLAPLVTGKTDKVIAGPRALLKSIPKAGKIDLTAPHDSLLGARAANHTKADDAKTLAIRGAPMASSFNRA